LEKIKNQLHTFMTSDGQAVSDYT